MGLINIINYPTSDRCVARRCGGIIHCIIIINSTSPGSVVTGMALCRPESDQDPSFTWLEGLSGSGHQMNERYPC